MTFISGFPAHKQPAPWIKASLPEVGGEMDVYRDGGRQKRQSIMAFWLKESETKRETRRKADKRQDFQFDEDRFLFVSVGLMNKREVAVAFHRNTPKK